MQKGNKCEEVAGLQDHCLAAITSIAKASHLLVEPEPVRVEMPSVYG